MCVCERERQTDLYTILLNVNGKCTRKTCLVEGEKLKRGGGCLKKPDEFNRHMGKKEEKPEKFACYK
jgi:hypothetical protein